MRDMKMNAYEILQLMWAGYISISQQNRTDGGFPYAELDLETEEADMWLDSILNHENYLASSLDDDGIYQPCLAIAHE